MMKGRFFSWEVKKILLSSRAFSSSRPTSTSMFAALSSSIPFCDGSGVAMMIFVIPLLMMASVHAGVFPAFEQGSNVT